MPPNVDLVTTPVLGPTLPAPVLGRLSHLLREGKLELPVLPEVANQVVRISGDENTDARKLAELIHRDQGLAGNVMRLVNSPMYAPPVPIVSLQQAVSRLGMKKTREIALIISCQSKVFTVHGFEAQVRDQFRHSLAAGAFAQEIARSRRWNVEEAFLCGLLHDVGRPVLLQVLVDLHRQFNCKLDPFAVEATIAHLHCHVGGELIKNWKLPARLGETILWHHDFAKAASAQQTAAMTCLADDLAHHALPAIREVDEERLRNHPTLGFLNLYPDEMDSLLGKTEQVIAMVRSIV